MATQKTVTLYSFSELSKEVQTKLIEECRNDDAFLDFDFTERDMLREFENEAAAMGIQDFDFKYSGFWSQGDGASFTGKLTQELAVKILEHASGAKDWAELYGNKIEVNVHRNSLSYVHHNSVECDFYYADDDLEISAEDYNRITSYFNSWKDSLCHEFYNRLLAQYEALISDENITGLLSELGEVFLRNGKILSDSVFDKDEEDYPVPYGSERNYYI